MKRYLLFCQYIITGGDMKNIGANAFDSSFESLVDVYKLIKNMDDYHSKNYKPDDTVYQTWWQIFDLETEKIIDEKTGNLKNYLKDQREFLFKKICIDRDFSK